MASWPAGCQEELNVVADAISLYPVGFPVDTDPSDYMVCALVDSYLFNQKRHFAERGLFSSENYFEYPWLSGWFRLKILSLPLSEEYWVGSSSLVGGTIHCPSWARDALHACHEEPSRDHMGIDKTMAKVAQCDRWPGPRKNFAVYVYCNFMFLRHAKHFIKAKAIQHNLEKMPNFV